MQTTDMQRPAGGAAAATAGRHGKHGVLHNIQLYSRSGREHCSKQSWIVLQQLCSGELLWMTGSAMQMRQRGLNSDQALQIDLCAPES